MPNSSEVQAMRAASVLCAFTARMFNASLEVADLNQLVERVDLLREPPFSDVAPVAAETIATTLEAADTPESIEALYHILRQDYAYLFYMNSLSETSPFESVYRTDDRTLFGPSTIQVRNAYRSAGFELAGDESRPDDHFGAEMEFIGQLLARSAETEDCEASARDVEAARTFASDHTLVFAPIYLGHVREVAKTEFYQAAADIAQATLDCVAALLDAAPSTILEE